MEERRMSRDYIIMLRNATSHATINHYSYHSQFHRYLNSVP